MNHSDSERARCEHRVTTRLGEWCVDEYGRDQKTTLVFLHGFPFDGRMWEETVAALADAYRVIVPDIPGCGRSRLQEETLSMGVLADDLMDVLSSLHAAPKVHLIGLSMGGYIGLEAAVRRAERIASLILVDSKAESDDAAARRTREQMARMASEQTLPHIVDAMIPKLIAPTSFSKDAVRNRLRTIMLETSPRTIRVVQQALAVRADFSEQVARFPVPLHGIVGEHDALTPPEQMQALCRRSRGTCHVVAGAGHLPPMENPAGFVAALRSLI